MISISAITLGFASILDWHRIFQLWQPVALRLPSILDGFEINCYSIVGTRNIVQTSVVKRSFIIVLLRTYNILWPVINYTMQASATLLTNDAQILVE